LFVGQFVSLNLHTTCNMSKFGAVIIIFLGFLFGRNDSKQDRQLTYKVTSRRVR